ncbi:MAG: tetratricopeptide repeat protein [Saprospiraceae bacterium]|nr:tetratricopeptide repeat protein [Saprospiraceae bacterium]
MKKLILILAFTFFIEAINAQQKGASPKPVLSGQQSVVSNTYAVVVGISDYQDPGIPDLRFADKDAEAFANYLRSDAGGKLDNDHLKVLINQQATMAQFGIALDWLMESAKEGDQVIIYFSGHGDVEKKTLTQPGFLLCWDAPARVYISGGAFALPMLQEVVSTISIQNKAKVIVITDACRSGKLAGSTVNGSQATASNLAKQFANEIKILSCQPNEYSIEGEQWGGGRGAFSFNLVNALYGFADQNNDLSITLQEAGRYLEDNVTAEVAPVSQVPMIVGNRSEKIARVDVKFLASIKSGKTNHKDILSAIDAKGFEDEILVNLDIAIKRTYSLFRQALKDKIFLEPINSCADFYYQQLINEPKLERLHSTMRRNYAAALQDDAQQVLNTMLKTGLTLNVLAGIKAKDIYSEYPQRLERAAELLGEGHYMYKALKARKSFFEGMIQTLRKNRQKYFYEALNWQSDFPHAQIELISTFKSENKDSAEYYAKKAMEIAPQWVVPYTRLSNYYESRFRDFKKAEELLNRAGEIDSNSVLVWYEKANFYNNQENLEEAIYWYKKALAKVGDEICFSCALVNLGDTYIEAGRYKEAEEILLAAIKRDSTFGGMYNRLGKVYWLTNRFQESEETFKKEIRLSKSERDRSMAYNELGNLKWQMGRMPEAESFYLKCLQADSSNINGYWNLAILYEQKGEYAKAELFCRDLIKLDSMVFEGFGFLGLLCVKTNRPIEAEFYGRKAVKLKPTIENYCLLVSILTMINKIDDAFEALEQLLEIDKNYEWFQKDPDIAPLRTLPKWNDLMSKYFPDKK